MVLFPADPGKFNFHKQGFALRSNAAFTIRGVVFQNLPDLQETIIYFQEPYQ